MLKNGSIGFKYLLFIFIVFACFTVLANAQNKETSPWDLKVLFQTSAYIFAQKEIIIKPDLRNGKNISQWKLDGSGKWKIQGGELILYKAGVPSGPIRRPSAFAVFKSKPFSDVTVEAEIKSEVDTGIIHRDLEIIIDYVSPELFYYIHLAGTTDKVHNGIFIVDNADRRRIDPGKGKPQLKDKAWHYVKVVRNAKSGLIAVYTNDSKQPVMTAVDKTICCGKAGVGSFDDTGFFKRIIIKGITK